MNIITGVCPICDGAVRLNDGVEVSEIISCDECKTRLVVECIENQAVTLIKAPDVEEDWGQ